MQFDVILVHPQHAGNIGFIARAMKTMDFKNLIIISNKEIDMEAAKITAVSAYDILDNCRIESSLENILDDFQFLAAFTARKRYFREVIPLENLAPILSKQKFERVGLMFGRENSGLTNEELNYCQAIANIPTSDSFKSLNLSHAVQIVCYEISKNNFKQNNYIPNKNIASTKEREAVFIKLAHVCKKIGLNNQEADKTSKIFRKIFEERSMDKKEAGSVNRFFDQIIHGV